MGSLALNHEGTIPGTDRAETNGVGALDALDVSLSVGDMTPIDQYLFPPQSSWMQATTSATTLEPPHLLFLELDTRTLDSPRSSSNPQASAHSFEFDHFSLQLPLFTNSNTTSNSSSQATDNAIDNGHYEPSKPNEPNAYPYSHSALDNHLPLFYTFFRSPSTSTTSLASSTSSSDITSYLSQETKPAMPGPTLAAPVGVVFAPDPDDHFAGPMTDEAGERMSTDQLRPHSGRSTDGRRSRSASPIFTLWARRHQHQQHDRSNRSSTESKTNGNSNSNHNGTVHKRAATRSRSGSIQKRQSQSVVPQMTREEFEALPLAIQRKYFSTLERLRFARDSGRVDGISQHYDDISHFRRRKSRQDRSVSEHIGGRNRRQSFFESNLSVPDSLPSYASLPDKIKRKEFTREEQVILASRLRASVILDAADEAICKINRRASRNPVLQLPSPSLSPSSRPASMDSHDGVRRSSDRSPGRDAPQSFYDSFRWLEEEEDLDLRLFLDDYHANLRDELPSPTKQQRPSFRRHLSISKIPFGRNSISLSRPGTKDNSTPISPTQATFGHPRRKSRALSLITPKHLPQDSIGAFDPAAAHYQDPEARLKLRVYLASPQKFDEAIEFGFPSADVLSPGSVPGKEGDLSLAHRRQSRQKVVDTSANMHSFLADDDDDDDENDANDRLSLNSDPTSMAEPDSPKTPQAFDNKLGTRAGRSLRLVSTEPPHFGEGCGNFMEGVGGYAQAPASSREMTLRMTLTRPDLRANEDQIYGWQQTQGSQGYQPGRKSTTLAHSGMENMNTATYIGDGANKESLEKMGANFDQWGPSPTDKGVMKRIWNRVRRA